MAIITAKNPKCLIGFVAVLFAFAAATNAQKLSNKDLDDLVATERAFSATAVKEGFRDSFIKFFADDGIGFAPQPQRTREVLLKSPVPTTPRIVIFNWQPMFGDISSAGDLGYTTGPVLYTDISDAAKPPRHGTYFSVWQKRADATWKVVVDMGSSVPHAIAPTDVTFTPARRPNAVRTKTNSTDYTTLDAALSGEIEKHGMADAYLSVLNDEFRLHRSGTMPIVAKDELTQYFSANGQKVVYEFIGGKIARSNDMAFTYGSVTNIGAKLAADVAGYYVHVWRRDASGTWKLAADILSELPKK